MKIILLMVFIKILELYKEDKEVLFKLNKVVYMVVVILEYTLVVLLKVLVMVFK